MTQHTFRKHVQVDFMPAHYDKASLADVAVAVGKELNLTDKQVGFLTEDLVEVADDDLECQSDIFNKPDQLVKASGLFSKVQSPDSIRRLMLVVSGEMLLDDLADYCPDRRLRSLTLSDFDVTEAGVHAIFKATSDGMTDSEVADYLAGQLSDGWGENGTLTFTLNVDVRSMAESIIDEVTFKSDDIRINSINLERFCALELGSAELYDGNDDLIVSYENLVPLTRKPNAIAVKAWF